MAYALPISFALLTWWAGTAAVLWLSNRPAEHHRLIARAVTVGAALCMVAAFALRERTGLADAYLGFLVGVALWGWHELMFLLGFVSGPRRTPCPPGLSPFERLRASTQAILYHEAGIALHALLLVVISLHAENAVPALTYILLWAMRISAKLLVFFGAPNIPSDFLPPHLRYLSSYFRREPHAPAALVSIALTTAAVVSMMFMVSEAGTGLFAHTALVLLTSLASLALFEHLALVVRLPDRALFAWALPPRPSPTKTNVTSGRTSQ